MVESLNFGFIKYPSEAIIRSPKIDLNKVYDRNIDIFLYDIYYIEMPCILCDLQIARIKETIKGDMYMKIMESFLTFFYILDQCYEQCQEDDLGGLLGAISPEIWEDGQPMDKAIFNDWKELSNLDTVHEQNIIEKVSEFLDYYEKEFGFKFAEAKKWLNKADSQVVKNAISKSCVMYEKYVYND